MSKYRKKPVVVDAWRVAELWDAARNDWDALPEDVGVLYDEGGIVFADDGVIVVTLEGNMLGDMPDWLIRGVKGEFYPCKPDIFDATYEPAGDPS